MDADSKRDGEPVSLRVLIAGGGVAALEALLALRHYAGERVAVRLLAPDPGFRNRPLSVAEPFGKAIPRYVDLAEVALEHEATFLRDGLASVEPAGRRIRTSAGREIGYDALLIAVGTRPVWVLPGAVGFRDSTDHGAFQAVLDRVDRDELGTLLFAIPGCVSWPLGLYELALLSASHAREAGTRTKVAVVTSEAQPLGILGKRGSGAVSNLLAEAGIDVHTGTAPRRFRDGRLEVEAGPPIPGDCAVTLPCGLAPSIPGIPLVRGFIPVNWFGEVLGLDAVYAAGDVTNFPVKQGGLAAQQADCAARTIAARAGADVKPEAFRPVLRGALMTSWGPRYLRSELEQPDGTSQGARSPLWWPPSKIAGRFLAPYLAARAGYPEPPGRPLVDLNPPPTDDAGAGSDTDDVLAVSLSTAERKAEEGDYRGALRWLEVAEDLSLHLPPEYELKRLSWQAHSPERAPN